MTTVLPHDNAPEQIMGVRYRVGIQRVPNSYVWKKEWIAVDGLRSNGRKGLQKILFRRGKSRRGAKFWLRLPTELHKQSIKGILIACVDGLKGYPHTIETLYPKTTQFCIVHMVRARLNYVNRKERKQVDEP